VQIDEKILRFIALQAVRKKYVASTLAEGSAEQPKI